MADAAETPVEETDEPAKKGGMLGKMAVAIFMACIIGSETAFAYFIIPSSDDMSKAELEKLRQQLQMGDDGDDIGATVEDGPVIEVELGDFDISIFNTVSKSTLNVNCSIMATVLVSDQSEFATLLANNQNRLREKIMVEFRQADQDHLTDPGLDLLKRRILAKSNQLLGKPIITSVVFPKFTYYQQ